MAGTRVGLAPCDRWRWVVVRFGRWRCMGSAAWSWRAARGCCSTSKILRRRRSPPRMGLTPLATRPPAAIDRRAPGRPRRRPCGPRRRRRAPGPSTCGASMRPSSLLHQAEPLAADVHIEGHRLLVRELGHGLRLHDLRDRQHLPSSRRLALPEGVLHDVDLREGSPRAGVAAARLPLCRCAGLRPSVPKAIRDRSATSRPLGSIGPSSPHSRP